jgi:hypothetical protein
MHPQNYDWKRYWRRRSSYLDLSDNGFLSPPLSIFGQTLTSLADENEIGAHRFAALLGEPGMGKTTETSRMIDLLRLDQSNEVVCIDLERCTSSVWLTNEITQASYFHKWNESPKRLIIFFENFEHLGYKPHLFMEDLAKLFKPGDCNRLYLRFISRVFEWTTSAEKTLINCFDIQKPDFEAFELAPLTKADIEIAAETRLGKNNNFIQSVIKADIVPLVIKPITLNFLLNQYSKNLILPNSATELYRQGCEILCQENNELRHDNETSKYTAKQLLDIASRIAAICTLGHKVSIYTGVDLGDLPETDIKSCDLVDVSVEHSVSHEIVLATLKTGLFSTRDNRCSFNHHSYMEFLAAEFLNQNLDSRQISDLLMQHDGEGLRVVPQLYAIAGWIGILNEEIFELVVNADPHSLIGTDLEQLSNEQKGKLVKSFLRRVTEENLALWDIRERYGKLNHSTLANDLRQIIDDNTAHYLARLEAIEIADVCRLTELADVCLEIALNESQLLVLRKYAGFASISLNKKLGVKFRPLFDDSDASLDDDLLALALTGLYPEYLTTNELFSNLRLPREKFGGEYNSFLTGPLIKEMPIVDIPVALRWFRQKLTQGKARENSFMEKFLLHAWQHLDVPEVLNEFVEIALFRLSQHEEIVQGMRAKEFQKLIDESHDKRHALVSKAIEILQSNEQNISKFSLARITRREDFSWLLQQIDCCDNEFSKKRFAELANLSYGYTVHDLEVLAKFSKHPALQTEMQWIFKFYNFNDPESVAQKKAYYEYVLQKPAKLLEPPPSERIEFGLEQVEQGNTPFFFQLTRDLTLEPTSTHYGDVYNLEIQKMPGWVKAEKVTQERIIYSAIKYLEDPRNFSKRFFWRDNNRIEVPELYAVKVLGFLATENPDHLLSLTKDIWLRLYAFLLKHADLKFYESVETKHLLPHAYVSIPEKVRYGINKVIEIERDKVSQSFLSNLDLIWDESIAEILLKRAKSSTTSDKCKGQLLSALNLHKDVKAKSLSLSKLIGTELDDSSIPIAVSLLQSWANDCWSIVWGKITNDEQFAQSFFESVARYHSSLVMKLNEQMLMEFLSWLYERFPPASDRLKSGVYKTTPEDMMRDLRRKIGNVLSSKGTSESVDVLEKALKKFPDDLTIQSLVHSARQNFRKNSWVPISAKMLLKLCEDTKYRVVSDEATLLQVVLNSLQRLQADCKDHIPSRELLWFPSPSTDKSTKKILTKYKPQDERVFCNFVAGHLKRDLKDKGVVVNREVEVRFNPGAHGERTDIYINAPSTNPRMRGYDVLTIVIEAKCSWHRELYTSMKHQLAEQ